MTVFIFNSSFFIPFGRAASPHKKSSYKVGAFFVGLRRAIRSITFALTASPFRALVVPLLSLSHKTQARPK